MYVLGIYKEEEKPCHGDLMLKEGSGEAFVPFIIKLELSMKISTPLHLSLFIVLGISV